jgi:hypothetical protein
MRPLSRKQFNRIKFYQAKGWSIEATRRQCRNSWDTIKRVFVADNYENYTPGTKHRTLVTEPPAARHINPAVAQVTRLRDEAQKKVDAYNLVLENLN